MSSHIAWADVRDKHLAPATPPGAGECVLCPPQRRARVRDGGRTCWVCHDRITEQLVEIVERYHRLDAQPSRTGGAERRPPGFSSSPPLNLHIVALRDMRTRTLKPGDPYSAMRVLAGWSQLVRRGRGQEQAGWGSLTVGTEATYLRANLDWITRQLWVRSMALEVRAVWSQLRAATGEPAAPPIAYCVAPFDDGTYCAHPLYLPDAPDEVLIRCAGCQREYNLLDQVRMRLTETGCVCGHADAQHDNDTTPRPCNVRWCDCTGYGPPP